MINFLGYLGPRVSVYLLVIISGLATLSWEIVWQIKTALALGVSAWGAALTLATTMGGMCIGALSMGHALRKKSLSRPIRLYGILEIIVGLSGLCLNSAFHAVEALDTFIYKAMPGAAALAYILGIVLTIGIPTICMGATLPVFGLMSRQFQTSIAVLYGLNTLGAAIGALGGAFILIPQFGVAHAIVIIASINIVVGLITWILAPGEPPTSTELLNPAEIQPLGNAIPEQFIVFTTGVATFLLEISWFRSLTATFKSTTDTFAIMLASMLIALGIAARIVPLLKKRAVSLGTLMGWAGILILLATPLIERFDFLTDYHGSSADLKSAAASHLIVTQFSYAKLLLSYFAVTFSVIGPPVLLLGVALPWILDEQKSPQKWGRLYALNTFAAIIGAIGAAWLLLPTIGFARTAWLAGSLVAIAGVLTVPRKKRIALGAFSITALLIAVTFESGVGRTRVQGNVLYYGTRQLDKILEFYEGPEATVSAVQYVDGSRMLVVDGFLTAGQGDKKLADRYMEWMGHLPMLLHPDPQNALVICFGTGQTANAVRQENPKSLDIVDINPRVFKLAYNFTANENVLGDPRVHTITMDGRAYIRRTEKTYDVITLEPMPPNFAGVNALYSKEFYEFARRRLNPNGVIAQWVPFHLISTASSVSIARTFLDVFPNAILWIDPNSQTGILLGSKDNDDTFGSEWPGFNRTHIKRDMADDDLRKAVLLGHKGLQLYSASGEVITDDNQLLAYGKAMAASHFYLSFNRENFDLLNKSVVKQAP